MSLSSIQIGLTRPYPGGAISDVSGFLLLQTGSLFLLQTGGRLILQHSDAAPSLDFSNTDNSMYIPLI